MIRLPLIIAGGVVAAAAAVTPAVVGLSANPSFSQQVPVRVPAHATVAAFPTATASAGRHERTSHRLGNDARRRGDSNRPGNEPGDDRGRGQRAERGDDRGRGRHADARDHRGRGGRDSRGRDDR